jgi:phage baseplate assembly protein W
MPEFQTFKDLSVTFKKHPVTDDLVTVKDNAAISQSIVNLLLTNKGERLFQPNLGSGIYSTLFEPLDFGTAGIIRSEIVDTISRYEPRIIVSKVIVVPDFDSNGYSIELNYVIRGREDAPVGIEFFLERTR